MRKLILIAALLLASASAQAGEGGLLLADNAPPRAISTNMSQPLPPAAKNDKDDSSKPQADEGAAQARAEKLRLAARGDQEAKARRMAARYGY